MIERSPGGIPETKSPAPQGSPAEEAALAARLERLGESLEARREAEETAKPRGRSSGFAQATKIASEFVAGVIVGGGIGWAIDRAFGVAPWGIVVFVLLGFAAGVLNVLRSEGVVSEATLRLSDAKRNSGTSSERSDVDPGPRA